jgi:hypothetical protein
LAPAHEIGREVEIAPALRTGPKAAPIARRLAIAPKAAVIVRRLPTAAGPARPGVAVEIVAVQ